jgi:hypothetical protein
MTVGIPGAGLGGLFFVVCALLTIPIELVRTVLGRSSKARWRRAVHHTALATSIIAVLGATYWCLNLILPIARTTTHSSFSGLPLASAVMTLLVVALVLVLAYVLRVVLRYRERGLTRDS